MMGENENESRQGRKKSMGNPTCFDLCQSLCHFQDSLSPLRGFGFSKHCFPPLKRWAILGRPCGTKTNHNEFKTYALLHQLLDALRVGHQRTPPAHQPELQSRLWLYLGGIARENKMKALVVGGVEDHVHVLLSIPSTLSVAKSIQLLKGNSSKWIHDTFKAHWDFEWQEGYGAFSIGISGVEDTTKYIQGQTEHHRKMTFREEIEVFLKKHGMEYVERDVE